MVKGLDKVAKFAVILLVGVSAPFASLHLVRAAPPPKSLPSTNVTNNGSILSRDNVIVFFDPRVRYHTGEADNAYTKADLAAMVNVISTRFSQILIDTAPKLDTASFDERAPSRVWIPSVVAQHNKDHAAESSPLEVIVSFDFNAEAMYGDFSSDSASSFDVARHMAELANQIYPNTVRTLMMTMYYTERLQYAEDSHDYTYWHYSQDWHDGGDYEVDYVKTVHHYVWPYNLGLFMDVHDCGRFRGEVPAPVKEILPYLDMVAVFIDPTTFHHLTTLNAEETSKMFVAKFEDCEERLQVLKPGLRVIPSALWKNHHMTIADTVEDWQRMSTWAKQNKKEVIMYEAFDTPGGRDFYYWGHGWWRLKDRTTYVINETSFVEKIEDANSSLYNKHLYSSMEEEDSEEETLKSQTSPPVVFASNDSSGSVNCTQSSSSIPTYVVASDYAATPSPHVSTTTSASSHDAALYAVLVLLAVICLILVVSHIYLHVRNVTTSPGGRRDCNGGVNNGVYRKGRHQHHHPTHLSFTNPGILPLSSLGLASNCSNTDANDNHEDADDGGASVSGSIMEMSESDTSPIVSVSYKKM